MCEGQVYDLIVSRRTVRRFRREPVPRESLERIANAGRLAPSAANLQPLEFVAVDDPAVGSAVFPCLRWAAYIAPAGNPAPGEEPAAYVVLLVNSNVREKGYEYDAGAAMENMILAARDAGLGSCWLISVDKERIREILGVPGDYRVDAVLALGFPAEEPAVEDFAGSLKYWKDEAGRLHVPKRRLESVLHINGFRGK
jgi:nitroreductase